MLYSRSSYLVQNVVMYSRVAGQCLPAIYMVRYPDIYKPDIGLGIRNTFLAKQNTPIVKKSKQSYLITSVRVGERQQVTLHILLV